MEIWQYRKYFRIALTTRKRNERCVRGGWNREKNLKKERENYKIHVTGKLERWRTRSNQEWNKRMILCEAPGRYTDGNQEDQDDWRFTNVNGRSETAPWLWWVENKNNQYNKKNIYLKLYSSYISNILASGIKRNVKKYL